MKAYSNIIYYQFPELLWCDDDGDYDDYDNDDYAGDMVDVNNGQNSVCNDDDCGADDDGW